MLCLAVMPSEREDWNERGSTAKPLVSRVPDRLYRLARGPWLDGVDDRSSPTRSRLPTSRSDRRRDGLNPRPVFGQEREVASGDPALNPELRFVGMLVVNRGMLAQICEQASVGHW